MRLYSIYFERSVNQVFEREVSEYKRRVEKRFHISEYRLKEETRRYPEEQIREILSDIQKCRVCLLDRTGKEMDSLAFARFIETQEMLGKDLLFVIGPHSGFTNYSLFHHDYKVSLSKMTFSHRIARLILYEQIYRAFCIITGHPYHK